MLTLIEAVNDARIMQSVESNRPCVVDPHLYDFKTEEGTITCGVSGFGTGPNTFVIYEITINPELRGQHLWSNLLRHITSFEEITTICVVAVTD